MRYAVLIGSLAIVLVLLAACGGESTPTSTATEESPGQGAQTARLPTPTPTPQRPGEISPRRAPEHLRLDLDDGVVVAFVEALPPGLPGKVAYVTHVPSGSQVVLDREGQVIERYDGRGDGPARLEAVLADEAAMERIMEGLQSGEDARPRQTTIDWAPFARFNGITYVSRHGTTLDPESLGDLRYRVAFRLDGYAGSRYRSQDGDAGFLKPGTALYEVRGYDSSFRLATLVDGEVRLYEADTNPAARVGADLLDLRGKVTAIDVLGEDERTKLATIDDIRGVESVVELVLSASVDQNRRDHDGERYFLGFRLADGTSVVRSFWLESGELSRGIMTDARLTMLVLKTLSEGSRP